MNLINNLIDKKLPWRFERKYSLEVLSPDDLVAKVLSLNFNKTYPDRQVNSLYFDTPDLKLFSDSINGTFYRYKIRQRWYNKEKNKSQLEVKIKQGELGQKQIYNFNKLPKNIKKILDLYQPTLTTVYQRKYFQHPIFPVRLTIDFDLKTIKDNQKQKYGFIILELKYSPDEKNERIVEQVGQALPLQLNQFSKYTLGCQDYY